MAEAKPGDTVAIHYSGSLSDGTPFDSSEGREPLEFTLGSGMIIPGLDGAIAGMQVGDRKTVTIAPEDAYGARDPDRVQAVPRDQFPDDLPIEPGTQLQMQTPEGQAVPVVVTGATETEVTLDANHPLAGKGLTFAVEIVAIMAA